jgi:CRP-like cAMP-binding protein
MIKDMSDPKAAENNCLPIHCIKCENRESSPLCSVHGADDEVRRARSEVHFKAGQTIFYEGNSPIGLYVIQDGLVKLQTVSMEGSSNTLRLLTAGQALGYRSLFAEEPYRASAICVEDSTLCFIPKSILTDIVKNYPQVAMNLLAQLSKDLRTAEDKWVTQVNKGAPERVAEALLFLEDHFHDQPWTRREIAQWAGTTPETVMRSLSQFEKDGLISSHGRAYKILDRPKLLQKSQPT